MELNKKYRIIVDCGNGKSLTYQGVIQKIQNNFVSFVELKGRLLTYNMNSIISYEEIIE